MAPDSGQPPSDKGSRPRFRIDAAAGLTERPVQGSPLPGAMFRSRGDGSLFRLGPEEYFLLREIGAGTPHATITAAFRTAFGKTVRPRAIAAFAEQMLEMGALVREPEAAGTPEASAKGTAAPDTDAGAAQAAGPAVTTPAQGAEAAPAAPGPVAQGQADGTGAAPAPGPTGTGIPDRRAEAAGQDAGDAGVRPASDDSGDARTARGAAGGSGSGSPDAARRSSGRGPGLAPDPGLDDPLEDLVFGRDEDRAEASADADGPAADAMAGVHGIGAADPRVAGRRLRFGSGRARKGGPGMIRLFDPGGLLRALDGMFGWAGPLATALLYPLTAFAALVIFHRLPEYALELRAGRGVLSLMWLLLLSAFTVNLFRVLCVGVTAHRQGATPKHFGIVFVFFLVPRFMIDETGVRQLPREGKLAVPAAALKSRLFLFGLGTTIWAATRQNATMLPDLALIVGQLGLFTFLLTALPVVTLDGYRYLTAYFDLPMLRERAFHHVFGYPRSGPGGMRFPAPGKGERWAFYFYVAGSVLFMALIVTLVAFYVSTALRDRFGGAGVLMFFALAGLVLFWLASMRRFRTERTDAAVRAAMASRAGGAATAGAQPGAAFGMAGSAGGMMARGAQAAGAGGATLRTGQRPGLPATYPGPGTGLPYRPGREVEGVPARGGSRPLPGLYAGNDSRARRARWRSRILLAALAAGLLYVAFLPYEYEVGGEFTILPANRVQVNAGVAGELVEILVDEGDIVETGQIMARLSDLQPRYQLEVRQSELAQAEAALQKLLEGARPEEIAVARAEVERAEALLPFYRAQAERAQTLLERGAIPDAEAERHVTRYVEAQQALQTARANLARVEAPASASEIAMAEARVAGLVAQVAYQQALLERVELRAPAPGRVVTGNLGLQLGKSMDAGDLFAEIENHEIARAEVRVSETDIGLVALGDRVRLRAWALSDVEWIGEVRALAPVAEDERYGRIVRVRTEIENDTGFFRPQMTGYAKIDGAEMRVWEAFTRLFDRFFRIEVWGWIP